MNDLTDEQYEDCDKLALELCELLDNKNSMVCLTALLHVTSNAYMYIIKEGIADADKVCLMIHKSNEITIEVIKDKYGNKFEVNQ